MGGLAFLARSVARARRPNPPVIPMGTTPSFGLWLDEFHKKSTHYGADSKKKLYDV